MLVPVVCPAPPGTTARLDVDPDLVQVVAFYVTATEHPQVLIVDRRHQLLMVENDFEVFLPD